MIKKFAPFALLAILALSAGGCHRKEKTDSQQTVREIDVAEAQVDSVILHKTYPGYLGSGSNANVVCLVNGKLIRKYYRPGGEVKEGQLLFSIDPTLYQDAVERAQAALTSAISQRDYAKSHYEAVKKALEAEAVSKMEVLQAGSAWEQAEANIKDCQAQLNTAQTNLGYCSIKAPISGVITDATVGDGNYINGAGNPFTLATIYENTKLSAIFEIEDAQYERIVGRTQGISDPIYRKMPLTFRDKLLHEYTADLAYEAPDVQKSTGTILLKGDVYNIGDELKNGMYVTVSLPYGMNPKAVLIKDASIGTDQLGKYVYLVNDSNKIVYTPIEVGELYQDSLRVVNKGVKGGDKYVTRAMLTVRNGETVKPVLKK